MLLVYRSVAYLQRRVSAALESVWCLLGAVDSRLFRLSLMMPLRVIRFIFFGF